MGGEGGWGGGVGTVQIVQTIGQPILTLDLFVNGCLVGLVVKASVSIAEGPGFESCLLRGDFSGWSHTSDLNIGSGYPVARLTL